MALCALAVTGSAVAVAPLSARLHAQSREEAARIQLAAVAALPDFYPRNAVLDTTGSVTLTANPRHASAIARTTGSSVVAPGKGRTCDSDKGCTWPDTLPRLRITEPSPSGDGAFHLTVEFLRQYGGRRPGDARWVAGTDFLIVVTKTDGEWRGKVEYFRRLN